MTEARVRRESSKIEICHGQTNRKTWKILTIQGHQCGPLLPRSIDRSNTSNEHGLYLIMYPILLTIGQL
jgi:hypothetical protein